jgi:hypothetical protein
MRRTIEDLLSRYGQSVTVEHRREGESAPVRAVVQPVLRKSQESPVTPGELGAVSRQQWMYIGEASVALRPGDRVVWDERRFVVMDARGLRWGDELLYYWALLRPGKEASS